MSDFRLFPTMGAFATYPVRDDAPSASSDDPGQYTTDRFSAPRSMMSSVLSSRDNDPSVPSNPRHPMAARTIHVPAYRRSSGTDVTAYSYIRPLRRPIA